MEFFSALVELIQGVAWPLVVLAVIWHFRSEVRGLLGRLVKIGRGGAEFQPGDQSPKSDEEPGLKPDSIKLPSTEHLGPALRPVVDRMQPKLSDYLSEAVKQTGKTRENLLFQTFTENYVALHLERAYRQIFGSQILALEFLRDRPDREGDMYVLETLYYKKAAAAWPVMYQSITFDQWLGYLRSYELIEVKGDSVKLTDVGLALTGYIGTQGYPTNRIG